MKINDIPYLARDINLNMPIQTPSYTKVKCRFEDGMPDDIGKLCSKVNKKFLDNHLHEIEEINYKFPILKQWINQFKLYHIKNYIHDGILNHDGFFKSLLYDFKTPRLACGFLINPYVGRNNGSELNFGDPSNFERDGNTSYCIISESPDTPAIGDYYNQLASEVGTTSTGEIQIGCFNKDNLGKAGSCAGRTNKIACPPSSSFVWQDCDVPEKEFTVSTTAVYCGINKSANSSTRLKTGETTGEYQSISFTNTPSTGCPINPQTTTYTEFPTCKVGFN
jgi:hypothetical protein